MTSPELIKDFIVPLILMILGASFAGAAAVAWWGVREIVKAQLKIGDTLVGISGQIADNSQEIAVAKERMVALEKREELRETANKQRHDDNKIEFNKLWTVYDKLIQRVGQKGTA